MYIHTELYDEYLVFSNWQIVGIITLGKYLTEQII